MAIVVPVPPGVPHPGHVVALVGKSDGGGVSQQGVIVEAGAGAGLAVVGGGERVGSPSALVDCFDSVVGVLAVDVDQFVN